MGSDSSGMDGAESDTVDSSRGGMMRESEESGVSVSVLDMLEMSVVTLSVVGNICGADSIGSGEGSTGGSATGVTSG